MGHNTHRPRRCRWTHGIKTQTVVEHYPMGTSSRDDLISNTLATDVDRTPSIHRDTQHPYSGRPLPLPHHSSHQRHRETASTAYRRGSGHMGPLGTGTETIPTMAIPPTIPHQRTPSRLATHHTATTRTTHGISRQLHTTDTRTTL